MGNKIEGISPHLYSVGQQCPSGMTGVHPGTLGEHSRRRQTTPIWVQ